MSKLTMFEGILFGIILGVLSAIITMAIISESVCGCQPDFCGSKMLNDK